MCSTNINISWEFFLYKDITSQNIVVDLVKCDKINKDYYIICCFMIQYFLREQSVLETLHHIMIKLDECNTTQYCRNVDTYYAWVNKDCNACYIRISSI